MLHWENSCCSPRHSSTNHHRGTAHGLSQAWMWWLVAGGRQFELLTFWSLQTAASGMIIFRVATSIFIVCGAKPYPILIHVCSFMPPDTSLLVLNDDDDNKLSREMQASRFSHNTQGGRGLPGLMSQRAEPNALSELRARSKIKSMTLSMCGLELELNLSTFINHLFNSAC